MPDSSRRTRRRLVLVIVVAELVVAVVTALVVGLSYQRLGANLEALPEIPHVVEPPEPETTDEPRALNILVLGSDTRAGRGNGIDGEATDSERSDVTVLLHVAADRRTAYGISIPRDAMVERPSCEGLDGSQVPPASPVIFNDAFAVGGAPCTVRQVEQLTGIFVDHTVVVDFHGFRDMVAAVEGVEICVPTEVDDPGHDIFLPAGRYLADPDQALAYVRERHVLSANSDIGRMRRQQAFMAAMVARVKSAGTLADPRRLYGFLDAATGSLTLDRELDSLGGLVDLAAQFRHTPPDRIKFVTVPIEAYPPDPNRLQLAPAAGRLWELVADDQPLGGFARTASSAGEGVGDPGREDSSEDAADRRANGLCA